MTEAAIIIGVLILYALYEIFFKHHHVSGYTEIGLPIYSVGPTYDIDNDQIAQHLEKRARLGVTIRDFNCCECGKHILEKMS